MGLRWKMKTMRSRMRTSSRSRVVQKNNIWFIRWIRCIISRTNLLPLRRLKSTRNSLKLIWILSTNCWSDNSQAIISLQLTNMIWHPKRIVMIHLLRLKLNRIGWYFSSQMCLKTNNLIKCPIVQLMVRTEGLTLVGLCLEGIPSVLVINWLWWMVVPMW